MGSQEIPSDIVFEILTQTKSLQTLDTCKTVCKEWKQMIYESSFMPLYCKRTRNLSGFFIQQLLRNGYHSIFVLLDDDQESKEEDPSRVRICSLPHDTRILASCNQGLVCCERRWGWNYRYYVCKPVTQQCRALPNPKLRYRTAGVAITVLSSSPLRYKIVRLSRHGIVQSMKAYDKYRCEIFDSETWKWRETQQLIIPFDELITCSELSISCSGCIHWLTSEDNVVQFNQVKECFDMFSLPALVHKNKQLVEYGGRLGLTCLTQEGQMELWIRENGPEKRAEWSKKMVVDFENLKRNGTCHPCPAGFYNGEIAFLKSFRQVVFYKIRDCTFTMVELGNGIRAADEVFQFRSDFEPVELKRIESRGIGRKVAPLKNKKEFVEK